MFNQFIDLLLDNMNPYPQKNSVIVMDNASIHKSPQLRGMIEERCVTIVPMFSHTVLMTPCRGMRLLYLPPYSPDFNPIEEAFSAMKAWIRRNSNYARSEMSGEATCDPYQFLIDAAFNAITSEKIHGWYTDCGY